MGAIPRGALVFKRSDVTAAWGEGGPVIRAIPFLDQTGDVVPLLTEHQRQALATISIRLRLPPRMTVYEAGAPAAALFAISHGMVKSFRDFPSGKRRVAAFLFPGDIFGLAECGRYINSARAITHVTLHRLPTDKLADLLRHDAELNFQVLCKVTHELREAQRRSIVVARRDALGRLAMFFETMVKKQPPGQTGGVLVLPMSRSDIADFLALSPEAVSRATAELQRRGIVTFEGRHHARVNDPKRLAKLGAAL